MILKSKTISDFCNYKFGKEYTEKDLKKVTDLEINPINIVHEYNKIYFEDLNYFENLKNLVILNLHVDIASFAFILRLENLTKIVFIDCTFQDLAILSNLKIESISFINSQIDNFDQINRIKSLKELTLVNYKNLDLSYFKDMKLTYLNLTRSTIKNIDISIFDNVSKLFISDTNIIDLSFTKNLTKLKELYINKSQYEANLNYMNSLLKRNVLIYINYMLIRGES